MFKVYWWLLLFLPHLLFASETACFQGEWLFDAKNSDNADRLLNKLDRKQKQQQKVLYRPDSVHNNDREDLSLIDTLPAFVFLQEELRIEVLAAEVLLIQAGLSRRISTDGKGQAISLMSLQQQSDIRTAGWDKERLIIETTTVDGSKVNETFTLREGNILSVDIIIRQGFEKEIVMEKTYRRKLPSAECGP